MERAIECPPSHFLPTVGDVTSYAALVGIVVHDFIVRAREAGRDEALTDIPEDAPARLFCEQLQLDRLPQGGQLEVAYAYDPRTRTARVLGLNIGRKYKQHGLLPHEVPGTADLVGVVGDTVIVIDWKTGFWSLGPAERSRQLRFLALCACRVLGLTKARVAFWYLREDGAIHDASAEFDAFDLEAIADEIAAGVQALERAAAVAAPVPNVSRGQWCRFCESKEHCPGYRNIIGELVQLKPGAPLDREKRGQAWMLLEQLRPLVEQMDATLRDWAKEDPFPTPDGRTVRPVLVKKERLDLDVSHRVVSTMLGAAVADRAVRRSISKDGLHEAVRAHAKSTGQKIAPMEREVLKAIADAKGVTTYTETQVRAVKTAG